MKSRTGIIATALLALTLPCLCWSAEANPSNVAALMDQGDKLWSAGKLDEARKQFEQAVAATPRSPEPRMKLAGILLSSGHYGEAIRAYQGAIGTDSKNAKAWIGMGLAYQHAGQHDLADAAFEEAIQIDPSRKSQLDKLKERKTPPPAK